MELRNGVEGWVCGVVLSIGSAELMGGVLLDAMYGKWEIV